MNQGVDEQMEHTYTLACLTKASTNETSRWCFNVLLTALTVLALKPETEQNILFENMNDSKQKAAKVLTICSGDPEDCVQCRTPESVTL